MEQVKFIPQNGVLVDQLKTVKGENTIHFDVLALIVLYGILTLLYQQTMQKNSAAQMEGPQAQVMKMMPLMFVGVLFFIPIPAGVMLYLVVTTALMYIQTAWVHWREDQKKGGATPGGKPAERVIDIKPDNA
jgi:membrane protein insertase Oxa1/YidC/SpoIIIJ